MAKTLEAPIVEYKHTSQFHRRNGPSDERMNTEHGTSKTEMAYFCYREMLCLEIQRKLHSHFARMLEHALLRYYSCSSEASP